jgi:histidinol dehydrogenase
MNASWFDASDPQFDRAFGEFLARRRSGASEDVLATALEIVRSVRRQGGAAVAAHTNALDGLAIDPATLRSDRLDLKRLATAVEPRVARAIDFAAERIEAYHLHQKPTDGGYRDPIGMDFSWRWTPIDAVGVYTPGGRASYPSSLLMNVVPARVAGVGRIAMVSPCPGGRMNPAVAYAAMRSGVTEFYPIGGAQAVAALAYGAGALRPVDKIVGPGNAWVTAAKRLVFGEVGIDTIAGPSEITVVADALNNPDWMAADLLSQAEHDPLAQSILVTDDADFARSVMSAARSMLAGQSWTVAQQSWADHSAVVIAPMGEAARVVNLIAPEHVEIATQDPELIARDIRHAGAMFLGRWAPEALGDYVTGSNHVLPTSGAARFASGLSVVDFMKRTSIQTIDRDGFEALADAAEVLAEAEGLPAHGLSVSIRRRRT